ncbi:cytochrome C assembly protein [Cryptococcus neoformans c45]|nr:cytochrome C assembly protein [Cryptococcus neoformans var. grubii c45]
MFRWDDCLEGHMLLGFIFSIISFICLHLTTFSTPLIKTIYFVSVSSSSDSDSNTKFGTFGYCITQEIGQGGGASRCSPAKVGYTQPGGVGNGDELIEWLIKTGILFGIGESSLFLLLLFPSPLPKHLFPLLSRVIILPHPSSAPLHVFRHHHPHPLPPPGGKIHVEPNLLSHRRLAWHSPRHTCRSVRPCTMGSCETCI